MKRAIAAVAAVAILVAAAPASPATPLERRVSALQRQTASLQRQVTTMRRQVRAADEAALGAFVTGMCVAAITADALQATWTVVSQVAARSVFPAPQTVNDRNVCRSIRITRQIGLVPPTISPFSSLLALLGSRLFLAPRL